jgi:nitrite reductase (NADH) small subunit
MADLPIVGERRWISLGSLEKIPLGQGLCFNLDGQEIAVFRQRDGHLFATQNRCPHRQGPLSEGLIGAGKVICPLHTKKFDLATGQGPEGMCLKTYPVREVNGEVLLSLDSGTTGAECAPAA